MKGKPGIISVGDRHEWPREEWGSRDWEEHEAAQRLSEPLDVPPVVKPPHLLPAGFELHPKKPSRDDERSRTADRVLEQHGISVS
jgi:hypothetical protein